MSLSTIEIICAVLNTFRKIGSMSGRDLATRVYDLWLRNRHKTIRRLLGTLPAPVAKEIDKARAKLAFEITGCDVDACVLEDPVVQSALATAA